MCCFKRQYQSMPLGNTDLVQAYNNVLKVYHIVSNHLQLHPNDRIRFPSFTSRPTLCYGAPGPLSGNVHKAEYFVSS